MLPVAKSTEAFFLNKTLFDTFSVQTGVTMEQLQNFEGFFAAANATQTQRDYETALRQLNLVQEELDQLTATQHREIVLEEYEFFVCNLSTLSATEYRVYELYLAGKSAKQIIEILGISENTLKYHNKNIYSKLGVTSRKQLLSIAVQLKKDGTSPIGRI